MRIKMKQKVVIIGAGPAGITAGFELLKNSSEYDVVILEESAAIGGISRTIQYKGNRMDIGGHRFFSKNQDVMQWWKALLPIQGHPSFDDKELGRVKPLSPGGPDPEKEDQVMLIRNRVSRIYYRNKFFDYPISMKMQTLKNIGFFQTVLCGFSYLKAILFKRKEASLEDFYINRFGKKLYSMFFEGYTEKLWGRHPGQISADWGAQRVKGLSVRAVLKDILTKLFQVKGQQVETSLIEEFIYPKYGPGQLWEMAALEFEKMGGKILRNHTVTKICCEDARIQSVTCETETGHTQIEGDIFISSMPLKDLVLGLEGESLPADIKNIAAGLSFRDFVTVGVLVNKINLKNETKLKTLSNILPDCWIYVQEPNIKLGRIQIFNNWSPYMVKDARDTVWIGLEYFCDEGDTYWNMDAEAWAKFAAQELEKMGIISADEVLEYHCEKIKKAYPAYFDTYSEIDTLIAYVKRFGNLYCVGRNGQHRYNNMDHSMMTSFETVKNILNGVIEKDNIWNVNTEAEYHEEKK